MIGEMIRWISELFNSQNQAKETRIIFQDGIKAVFEPDPLEVKYFPDTERFSVIRDGWEPLILGDNQDYIVIDGVYHYGYVRP